MCGIVSIINKDGSRVELSLLSNMASKISHRGPDEEGHLIEGPIGFYHKRLAIIDLISGQQPMTRDSVSVVFNGAIYNYKELRESLKKSGHTFQTNSDTEVILELYKEYGPGCVEHMNGMFAFLIYDRIQKRLIAARDHFGIKPLYYYENQDNLIFASEIKALLEHPSVKIEPDYNSIQDYIVLQYVLGAETLFKDIKKILPGHYHVIDLKSFNAKPVKYWEPNFSVDNSHTEDYFINKLREKLEDTVNIQLRSDVPVGCYLSGGIDSSIITLLTSRFLKGQLKTFTGAFQEGPEFNELAYAREVGNLCNAEMYEVYPK